MASLKIPFIRHPHYESVETSDSDSMSDCEKGNESAQELLTSAHQDASKGRILGGLSLYRRVVWIIGAVVLVCLATNGLVDIIRRLAHFSTTAIHPQSHATSDHPHAQSAHTISVGSEQFFDVDLGCYDCGETTEEAKSRGCQLDLMDFEWLQPRCIFPELMQEYLDKAPEGGWLFDTWVDDGPHELVNATQLVQLPRHGRVFRTTKSYHLWHCNYVWRRVHRFKSAIPLMGKTMEDVEHHILHCGEVAIDNAPSDSWNTIAYYTGAGV